MMKKDYSDNIADNGADRTYNDIDLELNELQEIGFICNNKSEDRVSVIFEDGLYDAEMLRIVCPDCGESYKHMVGYGPLCPTSWLRCQRLKENPPMCPKCGSRNYKL